VYIESAPVPLSRYVDAPTQDFKAPETKGRVLVLSDPGASLRARVEPRPR